MRDSSSTTRPPTTPTSSLEGSEREVLGTSLATGRARRLAATRLLEPVSPRNPASPILPMNRGFSFRRPWPPALHRRVATACGRAGFAPNVVQLAVRARRRRGAAGTDHGLPAGSSFPAARRSRHAGPLQAGSRLCAALAAGRQLLGHRPDGRRHARAHRHWYGTLIHDARWVAGEQSDAR